MTTTPPSRSVKIADDERGGWSSDRPRRAGAPRPADISTRCRVLSPTANLRYSPGSLLLVVSPSPAERDRFVERLIKQQGALLSLDKVRALLAGRVAEEEAETRAAELLTAAVGKRLEAGETVVIPTAGITSEEREPFLRTAARLRRPRHLILIEPGRDQVDEADRAAVNDLRRRLDTGELGAEGIQTAMRLSGAAVRELQQIVFQPAPREN